MQKKLSQVSERIDVFDLLRGYFVLVLVIDHMERWPGLFEYFTGQAKLWVTAAEGFFIVSGIMIGLIRGRRMLDKPLSLVGKVLVTRGVQLYLWAVLSSLFFTLWALLWFKYTGSETISYGLLSFNGVTGLDMVLQTFALTYSHGWTGFLKYYAVYIALAPIAVWLLRHGLWWVILLISFSVWLYGLNKDDWWLSWQLLFYGGAVIGFYAMQIREWWRQLLPRVRRPLAALIYTSALITVILSVFMTFAWRIVHQPNNPLMSFDEYVALKATVDPYFDIVTLQPLRVMLAGLWFTALLLLFSRFEPLIKKWLGWLLFAFGRNSLYIYILHGVFVFAFNMALATREHFFVNVAMVAFTILALWWLAKKQFLMKFIPR